MPEMTAHPSQKELAAYNLGQLPPEEAAAIENHISECEPCCDTIVGMSSDDTFVALLQEARQLSTDQTMGLDGSTAQPSASLPDVPTPLAEHPRYEIVGLIGKGGMGDVYRARHRKMERTVALKVINRELVRKAEAVDRFHREVKAAAQLSHPNIVTAYDADQADDFHFMVMEYVDGVDLSQTVKAQGALPVAEACDYIQQAAIGLQHAHERGMVHRDIKPHNMMVTADGTVKILDFGLASLAPEAVLEPDTVEARGDLTAAGAIMGTPDFISPEQAEDARQADIRSDIYSLGATLYYLLSGRVPFAEGSVMHKLKSHAQSDPEPLSTVRLDVPADLADIITRMMAKDPDERFQTPEELAEALKPFTQSAEPREIVEPPTQAEPRRWKPTFLSLTAVAVLFVAALFAGVIYYLQTDHGVVRVEVTDPSLQVTINDLTITMKDEDGKKLTIRPGNQTLIIRKDDADFEFETESFQIRRNQEIAFKVERLEGEVVVSKDGKKFGAKPLSSGDKTRQILDRMEKAYAECKSYRDSGLIKLVTGLDTVSRDAPVEYSFTTAFVRPDRFRCEIKTEDNRLLISANGQNVQTWWDAETRIPKQGSLEPLVFAMALASGFSGGDFGRIPALLMPQKLKLSGGLDLVDPKQIEDGKLQNVECFRLEYNFRDEQFTLWIDKQSYLVRRIDERIKLDRIRIERTTTFDPTIDSEITDEMLEFDPPSPRAADDSASPEGYLNLLQGDWDVITFTQNGKREFAADRGVGMLVQIKGDTITRIQTAPNGEKSEKEWGRIELNSKKNPKSIDIINPDGPGGRVLGIYELKDGTLKICFAERSNIDIAEGKPVKRPTMFDAPTGSELVLLECRRKPLEVDKQPSAARIILDQGYTILDGGKEIGSRHLVVTENDETLSIVEEYSLALQFDGAPLGIVERDVSAVYSVAGDMPLLMRGTNSTKEQGALVMHGTVEFEKGEAEMRWTSYTDGGRKLDSPSKQQATVKPPPGPLVLGSTIQVVGPLLLPEDGERKVVCATFNIRVREGKPLVEYEAGCRLKRTSRPEGEGFTITLFEPDSDKPEITWEYDSKGNCETIQLASTTVMKPHKASEEAEADIAPVVGQSESSHDFEREAARWVLENGGTVVLKNMVGRLEKVENLDDLPNRPFTITHIGLKNAKDEDLKRLEGLSLTTLSLSGQQLTDAGLAYLVRVRPLNSLFLRDCPRVSLSNVFAFQDVKTLKLNNTPAISDEALESLNELLSIQYLDIGENKQFTDQALVHIAELKTLDYLVLESTAITDAGLKHLAPLDELLTLDLSSTAITDAGLKHLAPLDQLYSLNLSSTEITDDGLEHLGQLDELFHLNLSSTAITDAGLKHLASTDLYELNLDSTAISDTGLKQLAAMDALGKLSLSGTRVTAQGIEELRETRTEEFQINWQLGADDGEQADKKVQSASKNGTDDDVGNWDSAAQSGPAGTSQAADRNEEDQATETEAESAASTKRKTTGFLVEAVKRGDLNAVEAALKAGVDPNGPANQLTALHWAVAQRISDGKTVEPTPQIAQLLIEAGADVNAADYLGQTPLEWAAKYAPPEIVEMLIKAGADVNAESRYGTVLLAATTKLQEHGVENAKQLIESGADVNAGQTTTPLASAVQVGNVQMIRLLIDKGAAVNDEKNPAIHWAGTPEVAKVLLDAGADVKLRNRNAETVLHRPLGPWHGPDAATLRLLVEAGADVKAKSNSGSTPLHAAVQQAKPEVARLLVEAGADVDAKDKQGNTPLSLAQRALSWARGQQQVDKRPYQAVVQVLVDAGAKDDGRTELQQAVAAGDLEQVKKLIADEVDVNETGPQRITAVHIASEKGHAEILAALIEAGAKFDQTDEQRMRPLHFAANASIARMLIAEGAKVDSPMPSPLYMATMAGKSDVVRELVRADATVQDRHGAEMLNWATFAGQIEVVKVLLEQRDGKTLLNARNVYSPLHVAASGTFGGMNSPEDVTPERRLNIAKLLVEKGADVNARWGANVNPQSGAARMIDTTPLMFASSQGDIEMVKFLIDQQAEAKAANASGQTALHFAAQHGHRSVVELLLNANADVNALTREAKTPLDVTQDAAVKILLIQKDGKTASELLEESQS